jgi:SOS-response transcriptional repressor LexA
MKNFTEIVETVKEVLSQENANKKIFDKDVADALGISQVNFATMKKRDKIPFMQLLDFCALKAISINWLLYNQAPESLIESTNQFYAIKYFGEVSASAGGGGDIDDEIHDDVLLPKYFIDHLGGTAESKNLEAIRVTGDSMEPTFSYDDIIFINRQKKDLRRGGIFVIRTEHGLFLKRLSKRIDGKVDILSDNQVYASISLNINEVEVIGRVVGKFGIIS